MTALTHQAMQGCNKNSTPLSAAAIERHLAELTDWQLTLEQNIQQITKSFIFKNFISAMAFAHQVTDLAEQENHHPRICVEWGKVTISWWTHSVSGLFINDFIMAARCDDAYNFCQGDIGNLKT